MARRLKVWLLGALALPLASCYRHHSADEDFDLGPFADGGALPTDETPPVGANPNGNEAGAARADAAVDCRAQTDLFTQLLCTAAQPGGSGNGLDDLLGGLLGNTRRDAGAGGSGNNGQITIEDILEGLLNGGGRDAGSSGLGGLLGAGNCRNPTDVFAQILCGLTETGGSRDAAVSRDPIGSLLDALSEAQCRQATQGLTQIFCLLRDLTSGAGRRDGGTTGPRRDAGARDAGAQDAGRASDASADASVEPDASEGDASQGADDAGSDPDASELAPQ